jgi:sodium pump decarboxylase gamma subunit
MALLLLAQAELTQSQRLNEALILMLVGMGVVFLALILLWAVIAIIDRLSDRSAAQAQAEGEAEPAPAPAPAAAPEPTPGEAVDPELLAVLTAAATAVLHRHVRISRVHFVRRHDEAWAREGRRDVMTSHHPHLHKHTR